MEPHRHIDARMSGLAETRTALVRLDDVALLLSASWNDTTVVVPRAGGLRRRLFLVRVFVPPEHQGRPFHQAKSVALYDSANEPLTSDDFGGVHSQAQERVTLAWFVADEPRYVLGGVGAEPARSSVSPSPSVTPEREQTKRR